MLHGDELTIKEIARQKKIDRISIYQPMIIGEKEYTFSRKDVGDQLSIYLPDQFEEMSEEHARYKYPSEFRPNLILTDDSGSVNITFSVLKQETTNSMKEFIDSLRDASKRLNQSGVFLEKKVVETENAEVGYYDYRGSTFSSDVYVLKFAAPMNDVTALGSFSCTWGEHDEWSILMKQIVSSIIINADTK